MKKRKKSSSKQKSKQYKLEHASRFATLLVVKIVLGLLSFGVGVVVYVVTKGSIGQILGAVLGLAAALWLYLFLVIKLLQDLKI